ncbi:MAG: CAP domain-containing protein [bacterium]
MKLPFREWVIPTKKNRYHPKLLRKGAFIFYTISLLLVNMLSGTFSTPISAGAVSASELIALCNAERVAGGLNTLSTNSKLASAAQAKAANMFQEQYWDHFGPNGETPWQFILAAGYNYVYAGENLAKGFTTSEGVHAAWMASASHAANIMNSNYKEIGIAAVPGTILGENVILVVQMFGATSVLPATAEESETPPNNYTPPVSTPEPEPIDDSLEITYPEDDSKIGESDFMMEGTSGVSDQNIQILNNEELLGEAIAEEGIWDFRPEEGWIDGEYDVHAEGSVAGQSDNVGFTVDTIPPSIDSESLDLSYDVGILRIQVVVEGTPSAVTLSVGEKEVEMEITEGDIFEGSILVTSGDTLGECEIIASDEVGNYATLDIAEKVRGVVNSVEDEGISIRDFSSIFNYALIFGLAILFVVDLYFLYKLKKFETHGKILFKSALWVIILTVTLIIGTRGTIT